VLTRGCQFSRITNDGCEGRIVGVEVAGKEDRSFGAAAQNLGKGIASCTGGLIHRVKQVGVCTFGASHFTGEIAVARRHQTAGNVDGHELAVGAQVVGVFRREQTNRARVVRENGASQAVKREGATSGALESHEPKIIEAIAIAARRGVKTGYIVSTAHAITRKAHKTGLVPAESG